MRLWAVISYGPTSSAYFYKHSSKCLCGKLHRLGLNVDAGNKDPQSQWLTQDIYFSLQEKSIGRQSLVAVSWEALKDQAFFQLFPLLSLFSESRMAVRASPTYLCISGRRMKEGMKEERTTEGSRSCLHTLTYIPLARTCCPWLKKMLRSMDIILRALCSAQLQGLCCRERRGGWVLVSNSQPLLHFASCWMHKQAALLSSEEQTFSLRFLFCQVGQTGTPT